MMASDFRDVLATGQLCVSLAKKGPPLTTTDQPNSLDLNSKF